MNCYLCGEEISATEYFSLECRCRWVFDYRAQTWMMIRELMQDGDEWKFAHERCKAGQYGLDSIGAGRLPDV